MYIYIYNEKSERQIKESIPFTIGTKIIKYLGINLPNVIKELYILNYKILMKEIQDVINGETDIENRLMDMGRGEERVKCMERVTRKLTLPYVKWTANGNLLYGSGNSHTCCLRVLETI